MLTRDEIRRLARKALRKYVSEKENVVFIADPVDDTQLVKAMETVKGLIRGEFTIKERLAYDYVKYATPAETTEPEKELKENPQQEKKSEPRESDPKPEEKKKPERGTASMGIRKAA